MTPTRDDRFQQIWVPVGQPGFSGDDKQRRTELLGTRFGPDGWRWAWYVRGQLVGFEQAIAEYEQAYRVHLTRNPAQVDWLTSVCGNVYDHHVDNVLDDDYAQPGPAANHYQDVAVRRVSAELTNATPSSELADLVDLTTGTTHRLPARPAFEVTPSPRSETRHRRPISSTRH